MKKLLSIIAISLLLAIELPAQTFSSLWAQVDKASKQDRPKTALVALRQVESKAVKEKQYGHLIASLFSQIVCQQQISADSVSSIIARIQTNATRLRKSDRIASLMFYVAMREIENNNRLKIDSSGFYNAYRGFGKKNEGKSLVAELLADKTVAAQLTRYYAVKDFTPLVLQREGSRYFNHDLISLIASTLDDYEPLIDYYLQSGNRKAACIASARMLGNSINGYRSDKALVARADSLIALFADLQECGALAIKKYDLMVSADFSAEEKVKWVDEALSKWAKWQEIDYLHNERNFLTAPEVRFTLPVQTLRPAQDVMVEFFKVRNISKAQFTITPVRNCPKSVLETVSRTSKFASIKSYLVNSQARRVEKDFGKHPEYYEVFEDSVCLGSLPLGTYYVSMTCDGKKYNYTDFLLFVTDLKVISLPVSAKKMRYVVVSATTGNPIPAAQLYVKTSRQGKETVYTTDAKGECVLEKGSSNCYVSAAKGDDKALLSASIYNDFNRIYRNNGSVTRHTIFTDRGIYRPGQTVHVSLLAYNVTKGVETAVDAGQNVRVSLYDANYNSIGEATVMTNEYGVAATEFTLPEKTLSGLFHIRTASGSESFRVEEYVRPTFEVSIPRPKVNYRQGDTITVKGTAKAYSGAPLGNARVVYNVKRQQSWWWRMTGEGNKSLLSDTVTTDMQGNFEIRMPMLMPEDNASDEAKQAGRWWLCPPRFYDIVAEATVTDMAGESHSASLSLPISNRESILTSNLREMMLRDSVNTVTFTRRNQAGTEIEGIVSVAVDGRKIQDIEVGKPFTLPRNLASGVHSLLAICEKDTIKQSFVIFSMDDKRPVISTPDWYYLSSDRFSSEKGKPVYVQFGSSKRDSYAYYALFSGDKVLESGAVKIDSSLVTRQFEYKAEYGDGVCLSLAWVRDGVLYEHSSTITKPLVDKSLNMKWATFRNRLQPGQRETWTLSVTDSEGKPANANVMATLYDKSLEAIMPFSWHFSDPRHIHVASQSWQTAFRFYPNNFHGYATYKHRDYTSLAFDALDRTYLSFGYIYCIEEVSRPLMRSSAKQSVGFSNMGMALKAKEEMAVPIIELHSEVVAEDVAEASEEQTGKDVALREKLGETAFFLSDVRTNADGVATLSFTLPESVTTWRFLAFANDKDMRFGMMKDEVVAQKQLMIQPRMPRFLREGDKCSVPATIANLTEKVLDVKVRLTLLDAETGESVAIYNNKVEVKAGESSAVSFDIDSKGLEGKVLVAKWIADAGLFSDGEQHYLPVLSAKELMLDTHTFVMPSQGVKEMDIKSLLPKKAEKACLTVEYTDAPEWLLIQSLPQIADPADDNAISLVASYYANTLASHIAKSNPEIAKAVKEWTKDYSSLESPLAKNEELRQTILAETPWIINANDETAQRKQLYRLFDASLLASRQAFALRHLQALQLADGGFSWWKGMESSRYMTVAVTQTLLRLQAMVGEGNAYDGIITNAFRYLDKEIAKDVKYMKEAKRKKNEPWLSSFDLDYLYCRAIYNGKMSASVKADIDFMMAYVVKNTRYLDMQSKAGAAIILSRFGNKKAADEYLQSIIEHTVYKEDMGRYFDSYRAAYSWADYRIPTQTSVIEAIKALRPEQRQTISEMQRWLLQSKRTQAWDTPVNAINAIYAFLGPDFALRHGMQAEIALGTETLKPDTYASALGYEKVSTPLDEYSAFSPLSSAVAPSLKIDKKSDGESWANVYLQYVVPASDAKDAANGISIRRELSSKALKVGDKVTVTITITADRDYDFVTVTDHRPACLEPVNQLSGYRNGCYQVMRDSQSQYHFDKMAKGKHVITTEYYVSRAGDFTAGTATVQCAYAPEFAGRTAGKTISSRK